MVAAKVPSELESLGDGKTSKVLISEGDNLALGDEASKLVAASEG